MPKHVSSLPNRAILAVFTMGFIGWLAPQAVLSQAVPQITVTPISGPRGTQVIIAGTGFTPNGSVTPGGLQIGGVGVNSSPGVIGTGGVLHAVTTSVPATVAYGPSTVSATDGIVSGSAVFTVKQPSIAISPATGSHGTEVTVTGSGWVPWTQAFITPDSGGTILTRADATGELSVTFAMPTPSTFTGLAGTVIVTGTDLAGNAAANKSYTVTAAAIAMNPTTVADGGTVTVSGTGFKPNTGPVALTMGGVSLLPSMPAFASSVGAWTTTFTTTGLIGVHTVSVTVGEVVRTGTLTVTATTGGVGQPFDVGEAMMPLTTTNALEIVTSFDYVTKQYRAFVPGLTGNSLTQIPPNSVIFITTTRDLVIVVSGIRFTIRSGIPTPLPVGVSVLITILSV